jgi:hypothetical protein
MGKALKGKLVYPKKWKERWLIMRYTGIFNH